MKKFSLSYYLILGTMFLFNSIFSSDRTFYSPREVSTDSTFELALSWYNIANNENKKTFQLYIKPFYQSTNSKKKIAEELSPNNDRIIQIREDGTGDIDPIWFNVIAETEKSYSSSITLNPKRITTGGIITFYAQFYERLWFLINTAAMCATNDLGIVENDIENPGVVPGFTNMCDGFNNPEFKFGKIPCKKRSKGGLDDIQVKFGCMANGEENIVKLAPYLVFTIPTGTKIKSNYLYEPIIGTRSVSVGAGLSLDFVIKESKDTIESKIELLTDFKYLYVLKAKERRSFDLTANGDWSRYLLVTTKTDPTVAMPGINFFTKDINVTPRSSIDAWAAFHFVDRQWHLEVGYNFWWRQKERITILKSTSFDDSLNTETIGIYDLNNLFVTTPTTASSSTIANSVSQVVSDPSFVALSNADLNINSAQDPSALSNKVYLAIAHKGKSLKKLWVIGAAASYEFSNKNAANQWAAWLTLGFDF